MIKHAIAVLVVGGILVAGLVFGLNLNKEQPVGSSGSEFFSRVAFRDNAVTGGNVFSTTSQGTATYTAASIVNSRVIMHKASAALTATLPTNAALSAAGFLPNAGDTQTLFLYASTTAITLAGGTGVLLNSASTTADIIIVEGMARLDFVRLGATEDRNIQVLMTQGD